MLIDLFATSAIPCRTVGHRELLEAHLSCNCGQGAFARDEVAPEAKSLRGACFRVASVNPASWNFDCAIATGTGVTDEQAPPECGVFAYSNPKRIVAPYAWGHPLMRGASAKTKGR